MWKPSSFIDFLDAGSVITALLLLLCSLAGIDLWRQYVINSDDYWFLQYSFAVRNNVDYWKIGFRTEDLGRKLDFQSEKLSNLTQSLADLEPYKHSTPNNLPDEITELRKRMTLFDSPRNMNSTSLIGQIRCDNVDGHILRVGLNDFRTDPRDMCGVFVAATEMSAGPHSYFEIVPFDEDAFGLKYIGNGMYLQVVPPPQSSPSLPWKIVVGGPVPGAAERFRFTDDGQLYSHLMGESN